MPHLYRHVTIREVVGKGKRQKKYLKNLAASLIRKPDLARLVRDFTLHVVRMTKAKIPDRLDRESPDPAFVAAFEDSSLSKDEKVKFLGQFSHAHRSHHDLILAVLLPALLRLERLVLDLKISYDTCYLDWMMGKAAHRKSPFDVQPPFASLTTFVVAHDYFNAQSPGFIASLLKLPALQKISAGSKSEWIQDGIDLYALQTYDTLLRLKSSSSPITILDIAAYNLSPVDLGHILRAPKALKTFFYTFYSLSQFKFTDLWHALGAQENCLESLGLDRGEFCSGKMDVLRPTASIMRFNTLKVFKIAAPFLDTMAKATKRDSLINFFPLSLETLHLTRFEAWFASLVDALEYLLLQKSPRQIPSLQTLILEEPSPFMTFVQQPSILRDTSPRGARETVIKRLDRVAAPQGVSLEVTEGEDTNDYSEYRSDEESVESERGWDEESLESERNWDE